MLLATSRPPARSRSGSVTATELKAGSEPEPEASPNHASWHSRCIGARDTTAAISNRLLLRLVLTYTTKFEVSRLAASAVHFHSGGMRCAEVAALWQARGHYTAFDSRLAAGLLNWHWLLPEKAVAKPSPNPFSRHSTCGSVKECMNECVHARS